MVGRLTERQNEYLRTIAQLIEKNGYPPTVREVGKALGIKSSSTVAGMLQHNVDIEKIGFVAIDGTWKDHQPFGWGRDYPRSVSVWRVGKKKAGRLLDGREWNEMPEVGTQ